MLKGKLSAYRLQQRLGATTYTNEVLVHLDHRCQRRPFIADFGFAAESQDALVVVGNSDQAV